MAGSGKLSPTIYFIERRYQYTNYNGGGTLTGKKMYIVSLFANIFIGSGEGSNC